MTLIRRHRHSNSTSSVQVLFTIHSHDWGESGYMVRKSIAAMIYAHMGLAIDEEKIYTLSNFNISVNLTNGDATGGTVSNDIPQIETIFRFMTIIYESTQYSTICDIYALIYLNKLVAKRATSVTSENYQSLWIVCVLLANTVWGHDLQRRPKFGEIFSCFSSSLLATLEQEVLKMLQYSTQVSRSLYTKYYFELSNYIFTTCEIDSEIKNREMLTNFQAIFLNLDVFNNYTIDKEFILRKIQIFRIRDDTPITDNKSLYIIRSCC